MSITDKLLGAFGYTRTSLTSGTVVPSVPVIEKDANPSWEAAFRKGLSLDFSGNKISQPYNQHVWVYSAIKAISTTASQVPFRFYRDEQEIDNHPIEKVFTNVNPYYSKYDLWTATLTYLLLEGNCLWMFTPSQGQTLKLPNSIPAEIYPLSIKRFAPVYDKNGQLISWAYKTKSGTTVPLSLDEVIHFRLFNPSDQYIGLSPLEAARLSLEADYAGITYNKNLYNNSAEPQGIISFPNALSEAQYKRIFEAWESRHKGVSNVGKIALLEGDGKWTTTTISHKDMQFLEQRRMSREEILAVFGVPKTIVSLTDDLNFAVAMAHRKLFWQNTVMPLLSSIEDIIQTNFINRYLPNDSIECRFDYSDIPELQEDLNQKATTAKIFFDMGIPLEQINDRLELGFDVTTFPKPVLDKPDPNTPTDITPEDNPNPDKPIKPAKAAKAVTKGKSIAPSLEDKPARKAFWKKNSAVLDKWEMAFKHKAKSCWHSLKESQMAKLNDNLSKRDYTGFSKSKMQTILKNDPMSDLLFDYDASLKFWKKSMKPLVEGAYVEGGSKALELIGLGISFGGSDAGSKHWIDNHALELATSVNDTAKDEIRSILADSLEEGFSVQDITKKIEGYFDSSESYKAERIARTETATAVSRGSTEAYRESGVVESQEFLASEDACGDCEAEDGKQFSLDENPVPLHCNCRCSLLPITKDITVDSEE